MELPLSIAPPLIGIYANIEPLSDVLMNVLTPASSSSDDILASAEEHVSHISRTLTSLTVQYTGLKVAAANLDSHILSLSEVFENFEPFGIKELDRQTELLRNHSLDLEVISKIRVHPEFLSATVRRDVEAGIKERVLGDYVSIPKMKMVADSCAKVHGKMVGVSNISHFDLLCCEYSRGSSNALHCSANIHDRADNWCRRSQGLSGHRLVSDFL